MSEVFEHLKCSQEGLTAEEGEDRLQIFGPNKLEEKTVGAWILLRQTSPFTFFHLAANPYVPCS